MKTITFQAANAIQNSIIGQGISKLLSDLTTFLFFLIPTVFILLLAYFLIRKGAADDDMDKKSWDKKIKTLMICCIGALCASTLVNLLTSYFG